MLNINGKKLCPNCFESLQDYDKKCSSCQNSGYISEAGVLLIGTILMGKYIVGKVIGRGGFGITYLSYDINNDRKVAIKEYLPEGLAYRNPDSTVVSTYKGEKAEYYKNGAEKFYEEAKTVSRFNGHPNIINVYEFFYENNTAYFVMEFIEGVDFKKYIQLNGGKLPYEKVIEIMTPILDALIIVHSVGILHRDISPDNIYITKDNEVKLLDFGAARQVLGEQSKSLSVILKQGFAPLEQYQTRGKQGPWSDVYFVGATMYYAITGKVPLDAMNRIDYDELPNQFSDEISQQLKQILLKALAVRTANRYQSVIELKQDLVNYMESEKKAKLHEELKKQQVLKKSKKLKKQDKGSNRINEAPDTARLKVRTTKNINYFNKYTIAIGSIAIIVIISVILILAAVFNGKYKNSHTAESRGAGLTKPSKQQTTYQSKPSLNQTVKSTNTTEEWKVEGYEAIPPYREYERLYINGSATDQTRYTGKVKPVEESAAASTPGEQSQNYNSSGTNKNYEVEPEPPIAIPEVPKSEPAAPNQKQPKSEPKNTVTTPTSENKTQTPVPEQPTPTPEPDELIPIIERDPVIER